jgi:hypothetical protein
MGHLNQMTKYVEKRVQKKFDEIETSQTGEVLRPIYDRYKDNPKIRFKNSFLKIIGLDKPAVPKPDTETGKVISIETTKRKPCRPKKAAPAKSAGRKKAARG